MKHPVSLLDLMFIFTSVFVIPFFVTWCIVHAHFLVVKFKSSYVLPGLCKLSFLHAFTNIPVTQVQFKPPLLYYLQSTGPVVTYVVNGHTKYSESSSISKQSWHAHSTAYQWTKALLEYIRSNLWSSLAQASWIAVVLASIQTARVTLAKSPPGTTVGGW